MSRSPHEVLAQEFLQTRAKILEIAAFYDRLGQPHPAELDSPQLDLLRRGCQILNDDQPDKAARVQLLFSCQYEESWREQFGI